MKSPKKTRSCPAGCSNSLRFGEDRLHGVAEDRLELSVGGDRLHRHHNMCASHSWNYNICQKQVAPLQCIGLNDHFKERFWRKHHKNCKCCPVSLLVYCHITKTIMNCNQCLKGNKPLGLSLSLSKFVKMVNRCKNWKLSTDLVFWPSLSLSWMWRMPINHTHEGESESQKI